MAKRRDARRARKARRERRAATGQRAGLNQRLNAERRARREAGRRIYEASIHRQGAWYEVFPAGCRDEDGGLTNVHERLDDTARARFYRLVEVIAARAPRLAQPSLLPAFHHLASVPWRSDVEAWRPQGKGGAGQLRALIDHLLVAYPMPTFMYRVFRRQAPPSGSWSGWRLDPSTTQLVRLFATLAGGRSLRSVLREGGFGTPLTRKMGHAVLQVRADMDPLHALRHVQVHHLGGTSALAQAVVRSAWGRAFAADESFVAEVIGWLARQADLQMSVVPPIIHFLAERRAGDPDLSLRGRTAQSVLRWMNAHHAALVDPDRVYDPSGFAPMTWVDEHGRWSMVELWTARAIADEGRRMRHCVLLYRRRIAEGRISIWSLRHAGAADEVPKRKLTVEVNHARGRIVQIRGKLNRLPTYRECGQLRVWAWSQGLEL